jgi:hypothetical protein
MVNNPASEQWRSIKMNNSIFKEVVQLNRGAFESFLTGLGFSKMDENHFKFKSIEEDGESNSAQMLAGNMNALRQAISALEIQLSEMEKERKAALESQLKKALTSKSITDSSAEAA